MSRLVAAGRSLARLVPVGYDEVMKLEWLKASVVVAAREHNPTILHPAFLVAQEIVPPDWELAKDPICTPAFAIVTYRNGITFSVEGSRFQVSDTKLRIDLAKSPVAE